jgi:hypothetical protein
VRSAAAPVKIDQAPFPDKNPNPMNPNALMKPLLIIALTAATLSCGGCKKERSEQSSSDSPSSEKAHSEQSKQKTNQAGYDAYMTGYNNPEQGDAAESMIDRFSGGDRQAALLMILGAEDSRKGLPIRFVVVAE